MWGVNWPMMKLSARDHAVDVPRQHHAAGRQRRLFFTWRAAHGPHLANGAIALLALPNVLGWHTLSIFGVQELVRRAAILGFTMPIFTVLLGAVFFGERITPRCRRARCRRPLAFVVSTKSPA